MAVGTTNRLGLTTWSAGTDPLTRQQLLHDHQQLDLLAAIDLQVPTVNDRPTAGTRGRYCQALDTGALYRDTGSAWVQIGTSQAAIDASVQAATATVVHATATDADALTDKSVTHYLTAASGNTNVPAGIGQYVAIDVTRLTATAIVQVAYSLLAPRIRWHRYWDGSAWSAWHKVSVSDLGAPTASLDMGNYSITGLADGLSDSDAANIRTVKALSGGVWSAWIPFSATLPTNSAGGVKSQFTVSWDVSGYVNARATSYRTRGNEVEVTFGFAVSAASGGASPQYTPNIFTFQGLPSSIRPPQPRVAMLSTAFYDWSQVNASVYEIASMAAPVTNPGLWANRPLMINSSASINVGNATGPVVVSPIGNVQVAASVTDYNGNGASVYQYTVRYFL